MSIRANSYVIDLEKIKSLSNERKHRVDSTEAAIYEMSVRDFSMQKEAGFSSILEVCLLSESPVVHGQKFGLDYLKEPGISHAAYARLALAALMKSIQSSSTTGAG